MPVSEVLSIAKTPADLDKAYASAQKVVAKIGIRIPFKKPDAKIGLAMTKASAAAKFCVVGDKGIVRIQVETTNYSSVLGQFDTGAETDPAKYIANCEKLAAAGVMSAAELKAAKASAAPVVDPTVLKNYLKRLADIKAQNTVIGRLSFEQVRGNAGLSKKLYDFAKSEYSTENLDFLNAVDKKGDPKKIVADFIATNVINLPGAVRNEALLPPHDLSAAYTEIELLLKADTFERFKKSLSKGIEEQVAAHRLIGKKAGIPDAQLG